MERIERYLAQHAKIVSQRSNFDDLWDSACELLLPRRMGFTSEWMPGSQKTDMLLDNTPMLGARELASAIDGLVKPKQSQWFEIETEDDAVMRDGEVARWLHDAERRMFKAMYRPQARFQQATGEADQDLVVIGNAFVLVTENSTREHLLYRTHHMKDVHFCENADGSVDKVFIKEKLPVRVLVQRYGLESLSPETQKLVADGKDDAKIKTLQVIEPRSDRDPRGVGSKNMPFRYCVIECEAQHEILESGFEEFPGAAARWDTTGGEIYGRGPGTLALPNVDTCQEVKATLLKAGHYAVDPMWLAASNMILGSAQRGPGQTVVYDAVEAAKLKGADPIKQLDNRANLPFGFEMLQMEREEVMNAFYRNVLHLPIEGPEMTATEVVQRREEFIRAIGAVFGRLETDYITPMVERTFGIMMRRSIRQGFEGSMVFAEPPRKLMGREIRFKFSSPIDRAKRQIEATQMNQWLDRLLARAQIKPDVLDMVDLDEASRIDAEAYDVPPKVLVPAKRVAEERQRRAEEAAMAKNLEAATQIAGAAKDGGAGMKQMADAMGGNA